MLRVKKLMFCMALSFCIAVVASEDVKAQKGGNTASIVGLNLVTPAAGGSNFLRVVGLLGAAVDSYEIEWFHRAPGSNTTTKVSCGLGLPSNRSFIRELSLIPGNIPAGTWTVKVTPKDRFGTAGQSVTKSITVP